jgi:hypothetical protein
MKLITAHEWLLSRNSFVTVTTLILGCTHEKWLSPVTLIKIRTSYAMDVEDIAVVCALVIINRKNNRKKHNWVHPIYSDSLSKGQFYTLHEKPRDYPKKFFGYYRMSVKNIDILLELLKSTITYQNTNMRLQLWLQILRLLIVHSGNEQLHSRCHVK